MTEIQIAEIMNFIDNINEILGEIKSSEIPADVKKELSDKLDELLSVTMTGKKGTEAFFECAELYGKFLDKRIELLYSKADELKISENGKIKLSGMINSIRNIGSAPLDIVMANVKKSIADVKDGLIAREFILNEINKKTEIISSETGMGETRNRYVGELKELKRKNLELEDFEQIAGSLEKMWKSFELEKDKLLIHKQSLASIINRAKKILDESKIQETKGLGRAGEALEKILGDKNLERAKGALMFIRDLTNIKIGAERKENEINRLKPDVRNTSELLGKLMSIRSGNEKIFKKISRVVERDKKTIEQTAETIEKDGKLKKGYGDELSKLLEEKIDEELKEKQDTLLKEIGELEKIVGKLKDKLERAEKNAEKKRIKILGMPLRTEKQMSSYHAEERTLDELGKEVDQIRTKFNYATSTLSNKKLDLESTDNQLKGISPRIDGLRKHASDAGERIEEAEKEIETLKSHIEINSKLEKMLSVALEGSAKHIEKMQISLGSKKARLAGLKEGFAKDKHALSEKAEELGNFIDVILK